MFFGNLPRLKKIKKSLIFDSNLQLAKGSFLFCSKPITSLGGGKLPSHRFSCCFWEFLRLILDTLSLKNTNFINLSISNLSIFDYPGQQEKIYFVKFEQTYESNLVKSTMLKQQLWKQTEDGWKIFFEGRFH